MVSKKKKAEQLYRRYTKGESIGTGTFKITERSVPTKNTLMEEINPETGKPWTRRERKRRGK